MSSSSSSQPLFSLSLLSDRWSDVRCPGNAVNLKYMRFSATRCRTSTSIFSARCWETSALFTQRSLSSATAKTLLYATMFLFFFQWTKHQWDNRVSPQFADFFCCFSAANCCHLNLPDVGCIHNESKHQDPPCPAGTEVQQQWSRYVLIGL